MSIMSPVTPSTPGSGTRFSERYEIKNQAGIGGMGTVYQAIDRESGNLIALKILHSRTTIEQARFDQEARVLSELSHPGIVRYFDHGVTPNGSPYIAMEWLEGETLEDRLGRGNLGPAAAAHLARLVLEALSAAHARNIVHRDIKPGNIFLVGWKLSEIRVLDFGIARRVFDAKRLTRKGSTVGTPLYTSPEQARGRADVDGRADIFSLGCVLFELLTGEPPFTGETPLEVMTKVCAGRVPELASRRPGIPEAFSSLVHAMLAPDPAQRPQSAAALATDFSDVVDALGGITSENAAANPPSHAKRASISESEDHLASAILVSLVKRDPGSVLGSAAEDRRRGSRTATVSSPSPELSGKSAEDARLADIRRLLESYACEMDRLVSRTLLLTAPTVSTAQEQAIQLASAALALHNLEPDATIAMATGRASFLGRLPVGRLMDCLPVLMDGQEAGTIRLDDTTRRLLPARFVAGGLPGHQLLLGEAVSSTNERVQEDESLVSPFLGREREIASLHSLLEETRDEKVARAVLVLGPPGQGKSRLLHEFLTGNLEASLQVVAASGTLLRIERRYPALASVLAAAGVDVQGKSSQHVEEALAAWIASRCSSSGFLLVIEDLQWADGPSLELVDRLLHRLRDKPFMVIGVGRDEVEDRFPGLWSARPVRRLRLRPLPPKQGLILLRFRISSVSRAAEDFVLERWEGNPQFLEEIAVNVERGTLAVPQVVHAVVEGRLEGVEPDVRRVLRAASLYGDKPFSADALIALLGEAARKGIAEWMEVLVMRDFIERDIKAGEATYRFRQRLVRDAAYQMLTSADRLLGRRLARTWLEDAGRTLPDYLINSTGLTSRRSAAGG
jgi:eukaryotic-like serine/threonine-protein kinase